MAVETRVNGDPARDGESMHIHLIGVCGTGMGAFAGLLKEAGHRVSGSDRAFHPPMGPALSSWGVRNNARLQSRQLERKTRFSRRWQRFADVITPRHARRSISGCLTHRCPRALAVNGARTTTLLGDRGHARKEHIHIARRTFARIHRHRFGLLSRRLPAKFWAKFLFGQRGRPLL